MQLRNQPLRRIDDLPKAIGVYGLADHLGQIHYIGVTEASSFRDRIFSRHVNGSEERSHKLACNYNIGRMWRNRKCAEHVDRDAKIAKRLRGAFILRYCLAACVPINRTEQMLSALEGEVISIAPHDMISWNSTRKRVNRLPEPCELVDVVIRELGLTSAEVAAVERQARLFDRYGHLDLVSI